MHGDKVLAGVMAVVAATAAAQGASAQTLDEVVVTAQKVEQRARDVPVSIAVLDRDFFQTTRTPTFEDAARMTPGLIVNESVGASYTNVAVRGIGSDALNSGVEPSVGVFVDGVYQARPAFLGADLFDVERVEVLRGPQGALYGKNTDAGAINVITRSPGSRLQADARAYAGSFGAANIEGAVGGPIAEAVRARVSAYYQTRDGYIDNTISSTGGDTYKRFGVRAQTVFALTPQFDLTLRAAYDSHRSSIINYAVLTPSPTLSGVAGLFGVTIPSDVFDRTSAANFRPHERLELFRTSATGVYDLGGGVQLTSITAFQRFRDNNISDVDYTALDLLDGGAVTHQNQISQELRINNDPAAKLSYVGGVFYFRQRQHDYGFNTVRPALAIITGGAFPSGAKDVERTDTTVESAAAFGQLNYRLTDALTGSVGLRFDHQSNVQRRAQPGGVTLPDLGTFRLSKSESNVSGSASLRYALSSAANAYATVSRGYKGGGYNGFGVGSRDEVGFAPEKAMNYEIGVKGAAYGGRLTYDVAAYYMKLRDLQVSNFNGTSFVVGNAAAATSRGVEVNLVAQPVEHLRLAAAISYGQAKYDSYPKGPCTAAQTAAAGGAVCTQNLAGRTIADAPKLHGALSGEYERPVTETLSVFARADYAFFSSRYLETALAPQTRQGAYGVLNARVGVKSGGWGLYLTAENLLDEDYLRNAYDYPLFNGAYLAAPGRPRTWGVELQASF